MKSIISLGLKKSDILKLPEVKGYINLTASIDDKPGKYGHNISVTVEQTKEERDAKAKRVFVGNGKVLWTENGKIETAKQCISRASENQSSENESSDPW